MIRQTNRRQVQAPKDQAAKVAKQCGTNQKKIGNKRSRRAEESDSEYLPTDIETQQDALDFICKQNNKRQKIKDKKDHKKQQSLSSWIYNFGSNLITQAFGKEQQCSQASETKGRRSCKKKQTAPLLEKKFKEENRLTLVPELPQSQKLLQVTKNKPEQVLEELSEKEDSTFNEADELFANHPEAPDFLELTRQNPNKDVVEFPLYQDEDLRFLDPSTDIGRQIGKSIVQQDFDDDCNTDEEMMNTATRVLQKELARGITNFLAAKYDRRESKMIYNYNPIERFKKEAWEEDLE